MVRWPGDFRPESQKPFHTFQRTCPNACRQREKQSERCSPPGGTGFVSSVFLDDNASREPNHGRHQPEADRQSTLFVNDPEKFHHSVYVILLDETALKHRSIARLNPKRDPSKPCVYVGMTGLPVEHRFENHKHGYKSSWVVRKYWVRLMPELYAHLNPMPFEAAVQMEMELAEDLRAEGYTVAGGK